MKKTTYNSLEELRADIRKVDKALGRALSDLERDAVDCVLPSNNSYLNSDVSYMRYVGYGITAYKTFNIVRKIVGFVSRRRWK